MNWGGGTAASGARSDRQGHHGGLEDDDGVHGVDFHVGLVVFKTPFLLF